MDFGVEGSNGRVVDDDCIFRMPSERGYLVVEPEGQYLLLGNLES